MSPKPATRKYTRSTTPNSIERRRLQNRIAQRNHRRRIKETIEVASQNDGSESPNVQPSEAPVISEPDHAFPMLPVTDTTSLDGLGFIDPQLYTMPRPDSPSAAAFHLNGNFMSGTVPEEDHQQQIQQWLNVDHPAMNINLPPPATDAGIPPPPPSAFFAQPACTCNNITGPCPTHLSKIRSEMYPGVYPMQQLLQPMHQSPDLAALNQAAYLDPYNSSSSSRGSLSPRNSPAPTSRNSLSTNPSSVSPRSRQNSTRRRKSSGVVATAEETDMTTRFKIILDAVQAAGFSDFDKMAAAYYTARFEKRSVPDLSQRASRSRRLKTLIQTLVESSEEWSRWESRGLQESALEATRTLCVEEMERLEVEQAIDHHAPMDTPDLISAFGMLSSSETGMGDEKQCSSDSGSDEGGLTRKISRQLVSALSDRTDAVQDSAPCLWSLLTELAGPQSLYCDRIAQLVLAILVDSRRAQ